jgi:sugar phosphate isomerase/epimerase
MSNKPIALQLYTVRDETARDFQATIRYVAKLGYDAVEFAGYGNLSSNEMAALLTATGLRVAGTHVRWDALENNLAGQIDYCLAIGSRNMTLPYLGNEWYTGEKIKTLAALLNDFGRAAQEKGVTFSYHNHAHEFAQGEDGRYLLDALLDSTDPAYVKLELDTYWAAYAGVDPIAYLHKRAGRVPLIHLKDMTPERTFTEVGDGTLNIQGICKAAEESGVEWYIVENDAPVLPSLKSIERSLENLQKILR